MSKYNAVKLAVSLMDRLEEDKDLDKVDHKEPRKILWVKPLVGKSGLEVMLNNGETYMVYVNTKQGE